MNFQELTQKIKPIAERIMKANNTLQKQRELCELYGSFASPSQLAFHAAKMVLLFDKKLSFEY